jgi:NifU-like protein
MNVNFYPKQINERFYAPKRAGNVEKANAVGTGAAFVCGSFVRVFLEIDAETKQIRDAKFKSNGCGFAVAAADVLTEKIIGRRLIELHGADNIRKEIESKLNKFPKPKRHCLEICIEAVQAAFADFRSFQLEEFAGEKALICTCFGVSEGEIENIIAESKAETVEEVGEICNAGTGCGSCRFLIQELIDVHEAEARA